MAWTSPESPVREGWSTPAWQHPPAIAQPREASYGRRVAAGLIDLVLAVMWFFVPFLVFGFIAGIVGTSDAFDDKYGIPGGFVVAGLLIVGFPIALMVRRGGGQGQTLGKEIVGLRVVRADDGERVGFGRLVVRELVGKLLLGATLLWLVLDVLWPAFDSRRQALHDKLASTIVVDAQAGWHEPQAPPDPFGGGWSAARDGWSVRDR